MVKNSELVNTINVKVAICKNLHNINTLKISKLKPKLEKVKFYKLTHPAGHNKWGSWKETTDYYIPSYNLYFNDSNSNYTYAGTIEYPKHKINCKNGEYVEILKSSAESIDNLMKKKKELEKSLDEVKRKLRDEKINLKKLFEK